MRYALALPALLLAASLSAQTLTLEYQVKATYLFNFVSLVEWPEDSTGPLVVCVAGRNPFGEFLAETVRGEQVNGRPLTTRVILEPEPGCHVIFIPRGAATSAYLRAARNMPTLTVGETAEFISQGGIINFFLEAGKVRFEINIEAAERANVRISSRLLRLSRMPEQ